MTGPQRRWPRWWWPVLPLALVGLLVVIVLAQKPSAPLSVAPEPTGRTSVPSSNGPGPTTSDLTPASMTATTASTPASRGTSRSGAPSVARSWESPPDGTCLWPGNVR